MPEPAECSCACRQPWRSQASGCREGMLLGTAAFPSSQDLVHVLHWGELGGGPRSPHSCPPGKSFPWALLATAVSSGWQKTHYTVATQGKGFLPIPKQPSPSYAPLHSQESCITIFIRKYTEFDDACFGGFFGGVFCWGFFLLCFAAFSLWTVNSYSINIFFYCLVGILITNIGYNIENNTLTDRY